MAKPQPQAYSAGDLPQALRDHFAAVPAVQKLNKKSQQEFFRWLTRSRPFHGLREFDERLAEAKIRGLEPAGQRAIVGSLRLQLKRRPMLAGLVLASLGGLVYGLGGDTTAEAVSPAPGDVAGVRPLVAAVQRRQVPVGEAFAELVYGRQRQSAIDEAFFHALDTSNWMRAASLLVQGEFRQRLEQATIDTPMQQLFTALRTLQAAWEYLTATRDQWRNEYFVGYAFGRMAALSPATPDLPQLPNYDPQGQAYASAINEIAPLFHALEILNQRFLSAGVSASSASVRFTQGHNFTFAHLETDLLNSELFSYERPSVLVNWDAHADLSDPFDNPRMPLDKPFALLRDASNFAERVVVASSMSIAGWILPMVYQQLLSRNDEAARLVWVVPRESHETSSNYMPGYGQYELFVGDWLVPEDAAEFDRLSTTPRGDWNQPGTRELRHFSGQPLLRSVSDPQVLENLQRCQLHIVAPDDSEQLASLLADRQIALSVDADFSGTIEPGVLPRRGFLPHYPLNASADEQARHQELLDQFAAFYQQHASAIHSISIANSPNFTADVETRRPISQLLRTVVGDTLAKQPAWLRREVDLQPPELSDGERPWSWLLSAGGIAGLATTAALLSGEQRRLRAIRQLLFSDST